MQIVVSYSSDTKREQIDESKIIVDFAKNSNDHTNHFYGEVAVNTGMAFFLLHPRWGFWFVTEFWKIEWQHLMASILKCSRAAIESKAWLREWPVTMEMN